MANRLLSRKDLPFVKIISELTMCNPFTERRIELEQKALGDQYHQSVRPWNVEHSEEAPNPNVAALVEKGEAIAESCQQALVKQSEVQKDDFELYQNLVNFIVYHRYRDNFDHLIKRVHERGGALENIRFFNRFSRDIKRYYAFHESTATDPAHLFACYYQIRRAFYHTFSFIVGTSKAALDLRARVWQSIFTHDMARYQRALYNRMGDIITLITGPSGTGKELVARAIGLSRFIPFDENTNQFPEDFLTHFHPVNLASLSPTLLESELFGHRKGAFTGALQDRKGYFEISGSYGTVFLDEIGEIDPAIQVKLLRVLQTRQFQRLGDTNLRPFSGKVIAATNRDLATEIEQGNFREDFYYRLCADQIQTPSLSEIIAGNKDELCFLVRYISEKFAGPEEADRLCEEVCSYISENLGDDYEWPGNFRELEQSVRNILIHGEYKPEPQTNPKDDIARQFEEGKFTADAFLSQYITSVYRKTKNYEETGRRLEIDRRTVKKYVDESLL